MQGATIIPRILLSPKANASAEVKRLDMVSNQGVVSLNCTKVVALQVADLIAA